MAPEILSQQPYGKECDYWSIGVVLYILLCGYPPFYDDDNFILFEKIKKGQYEFPAPHWENISQDAINIIKGLLVVDPAKRTTPEDLLKNPWVNGEAGKKTDKEIINKMRVWNSKRKMIEEEP